MPPFLYKRNTKLTLPFRGATAPEGKGIAPTFSEDGAAFPMYAVKRGQTVDAGARCHRGARDQIAGHLTVIYLLGRCKATVGSRGAAAPRTSGEAEARDASTGNLARRIHNGLGAIARHRTASESPYHCSPTGRRKTERVRASSTTVAVHQLVTARRSKATPRRRRGADPDGITRGTTRRPSTQER